MKPLYWFLVRWNWPLGILALILLVIAANAPIHPQSSRINLFWDFLILISLFASVVLWIGSRDRAKQCSPTPGEQIIFSEARASGHSNKNRFYAAFMVKRTLIVEVTLDTIFIRPRGLASSQGDVYHSFLRIPIREVTRSERRGNSIRLGWRGATDGDFTLLLSDPDAFLTAIHRTGSSTVLNS